MPTVLRYVEREPSGSGTPRHRDITVTGEAAREGLDASMERLGFVFHAVVETETSSARSAFPRPGEAPPAFPSAADSRPLQVTSGAGRTEPPMAPDDRPTPVEPPPPSLTRSLRERFEGDADGARKVPASGFAADLRRRSTEALKKEIARSLVKEASAGSSAPQEALPAPAMPRVEIASAAELSTPRATSWNTIALYVAIVGSFIVQSPVVHSDFKHDDFLHFYMAEAVPFLRYLMTPFAGHIMAVHRLAYVALKAMFGLDAHKFFLVMIATHCLNVVLLHVFLNRVTGKPALSAFFAGLWGMAPVHTPTMNWFACYGQLQCVAFTLWVLIELVGFANRKEPPTTAAIVRWTVLLLLGAASFGLGLVLAVAFPVMAYVVLEPPSKPLRTALSLVPLPVLVVAMWWFSHTKAEGSAAPASAAVHALEMIPRLAESFAQLAAYGTATLVAPLLTLSFRGRAVFPWAKLNFNQAIGWSYPFLALLIVLVSWGFSRADRRARRHFASAVVMIVSAYGIVALTRGALIFDLSFISTQSRYHYGQTTALALLMALSCASFDWPMLERGNRSALASAVALALIVFPNRWATSDMDDGFAIGSRDVMVASDKDLTIAGKTAAASTPPGRPIFLSNTKFSPLLLLFGMGVQRELFPDLGAYWVIRYGPNAKLDGHDVRFVAPEDLVKKVRAGDLPRVSHLFVTPAEARKQGATVVEIPRMCFYAPGMTEVVREMPLTKVDLVNIQEELDTCKFTDRAKDAMRREILASPSLLEQTKRQIRESNDPKIMMQIRAEILADEEKTKRYRENAAKEEAERARLGIPPPAAAPSATSP